MKEVGLRATGKRARPDGGGDLVETEAIEPARGAAGVAIDVVAGGFTHFRR